MPRFTEWDLNAVLHVFLGRHKEFMLVFQDSDLHVYTDRYLIPIMVARSSSKERFTRRSAKTRRDRHISVDPQQFRPDAVLVTRDGRPCVLETKVGRVNSVAECEALVVQTLVYADLLLSPRWKPATRCQNSPASTTYDLLEDLHEAHWWLKVAFEGVYRPLEERHQRYFRLKSPVGRQRFEQVPSVVFLLDGVNRRRLEEACRRVRKTDYAIYREHAEQVLPKRCQFRKHLASLEGNWGRLQREVDFYMMPVNTRAFEKVVGGDLELLSER